MSTATAKPAPTPIPGQLTDSEFTAFILPHLSMPKRGPKCTLGSHRVLNLILWLLYTGMPWKCFPVPTDSHEQPLIHSTTVYKVFARWADDGSLWQACIASVTHLAAEKHLDTSVLPGDGTSTVAKKGAMGLRTRATNTRRGRKSSRASTTTALCWLPSPWLP
jgi:transposase